MVRTVALLLLALGFTLAPRLSPAADMPTPAADYTLKSPYSTEEEYIVSSVCRNAYELLSYAADKKGEIILPEKVTAKKIATAGVAYEVTLHGAHGTIDVTLHWPGSIWASPAYVPFCQAAMASLKVPRAAANPQTQGDPLATLLDFSEKSIESENERISQWLATDPANPQAHEQAAFLLGVLALKENSGWFWDPRDACNQLAAHLAVARALRHGADVSLEGRFAECARGLIDDTKTECTREIDAMDKLPSPPPELASWLRAARMRNTRDWRVLDQPETATGVEQVEFIRAYSEAVSTDQACTWLQAHPLPDRPDFTRVVLESGFSVENGHQYAQPSVEVELAAMRGVFPDRFGHDTMVDDLNTPPGNVLSTNPAGQLGPSVINRGMWAQFFQRHLCLAIVETGYFLSDLWGVPDDTATFEGKVNHDFASLTLYPYVQAALAILRRNKFDGDAVLSAFSTHPEWASSWVYHLPKGTTLDQARFQALVQAWFTPPVPSGSAYSAGARLFDVAAAWMKQPAAIDRLYAIAPCQFSIADAELSVHASDGPTYDQAFKVMGPMLDYSLQAVDRVTSARGVELGPRVSLEEKAASIDPERFRDLAFDLERNHRDSDAAEAYQNYFDHGTDRVSVSNSMAWLVTYDFDHGQKDQALTIAQACADVYSAVGLETMMDLQVRLGQLDQAEDYGKKILERYNEATPLLLFYHAQAKAGVAGYQAKFDSSLSAEFPDGLVKVTLSTFKGAPTFGLRFGETNAALQKWGLGSSQVIVALDGLQVQNRAQYTIVRSLTDSPDMTFIVWDGIAYREIKATQPTRKFGVDLSDYTP